MRTYTTRTATDTCLLCLENAADNTRAHIITKLLTKAIFGAKKQGKAYVLVVKGGELSFLKRPEQDTPTEDYMVCTSCEKRMEKVETYIGNSFYHRYRKAKYKAEFSITYQQLLGPGNFNFLISKNVEPYSFSLFIWMQLWRASVSQSEAFKDIKLPAGLEDALRSVLNTCLHNSQAETMKYCRAHPELFNGLVYSVLMPQGKFNPESQIVGARTVTDGLYLIYASGLLFTCYVGDSGKSGIGFNNGSKPVEMAMMRVKDWDKFKWKAMMPPNLYPYIDAMSQAS